MTVEDAAVSRYMSAAMREAVTALFPTPARMRAGWGTASADAGADEPAAALIRSSEPPALQSHTDVRRHGFPARVRVG